MPLVLKKKTDRTLEFSHPLPFVSSYIWPIGFLGDPPRCPCGYWPVSREVDFFRRRGDRWRCQTCDTWRRWHARKWRPGGWPSLRQQQS
ncbi:hypothetical protein E1A91_A12G090600v1 [Gossypium mustelinum]|uniref:Uncharacterized protein n=1 Tax=Gossypium mustelinum TaxID=34275 RepID=A0A5D2WRT4_GOSMU|nr:hypothetical protein E1A91_A12G090600v1 [Gossypium mustelinum]